MSNKGMITQSFKRLFNGYDNITIDNIISNKPNNVNNSIKTESIKPDVVNTYKRKKCLKMPSSYDVYHNTSDSKCRKYGNKYLEFNKDVFHLNKTEVKQFKTLVNVACNVFATSNGYVSIKDIKEYLITNKFAILDNTILSDVVKAYLIDRPHLKKKYSYNRVKSNNEVVGYCGREIRPKSCYDKEKWSKLMGICEL